MNCADYILCTAAKDEAASIASLIEDVVAQKQRPGLWVIVDDSSTDGTSAIVERYASRYSWIRLVRYGGERDKSLLMHISKVKSLAAGSALGMAAAEGIAWSCIGILDADMSIDKDFYALMLSRLDEDASIGLIGAGILSRTDKGPVLEAARPDLPGSATMLCRGTCFEQIGGVPDDMYPEDAIMLARAKLAGWKTERSTAITAVQARGTGSKYGEARGYALRGERIYYLRYPLAYLMIRAAYLTLKKGPHIAMAFLFGYARCWIRGAKRLEDRELIEYFSGQRFREVISYNLDPMLEKIRFRRP